MRRAGACLLAAGLTGLLAVVGGAAPAHALTEIHSGEIGDGDPTLRGALITPPTCNGLLGSPRFRYDAVPFTPLVDGVYTISTTSASDDTASAFVSMYLHAAADFDPEATDSGCLAADNAAPASITTELAAGTPYLITIFDDSFEQTGGTWVTSIDGPTIGDLSVELGVSAGGTEPGDTVQLLLSVMARPEFDDVEDVTVKVSFPDAFVPGSFAGTLTQDGAAYDCGASAGLAIVCTAPTRAAGDITNFSFSARLVDEARIVGGTADIVATVSAATPDARPADNTSVIGVRSSVLAFVSTEPARFADSRDAPTFDGAFRETGTRPGGTSWEIAVAGRGEVPADASAAIVNLTVTNGAGPGYATVFPCDDRPTASSVNYTAGSTDPNELIAKLSPRGTLCVFTLTAAEVIVDVVGYVPEHSPYTALAPARFADSRDAPTFDGDVRNTGPRPDGTVWEIPISGRGAVPEGATAAVVNLTVTGATRPGYATVYPCTEDRPQASSLNYAAGMTRPNELIAKLSPAGSICVFTLSATDVVVDVVGYLGSTEWYTPLTPQRFADSRDLPTADGAFRDTGRRTARSVWEIAVAGRGDVPQGATIAVLNLTVTGTGGHGYATAYPCSTDRPGTSSLNYVPDGTRANEIVVKLSATGSTCVFTLADADVIVDVVGFGAG